MERNEIARIMKEEFPDCPEEILDDMWLRRLANPTEESVRKEARKLQGALPVSCAEK
ncbi:MAG: hypothetical protein HYT12_03500 [Candidatus Liptonbacteria bacterium]|nr:hypothetical protein [Candidatus Liptonbacteria bacterium]